MLVEPLVEESIGAVLYVCVGASSDWEVSMKVLIEWFYFC